MPVLSLIFRSTIASLANSAESATAGPCDTQIGRRQTASSRREDVGRTETSLGWHNFAWLGIGLKIDLFDVVEDFFGTAVVTTCGFTYTTL